MTFKLPGRILETFVTTGTGTITLDGAVSGYKTFSSELSNADTCHYFMFGGSNYEEGYGTYSGGTLARTAVLRSSNSNNAVSWASGTKYVGIAPLGPSDLDAANLRRLWSAMGISDRRVRAATTANITISTALNNGDTLDGVTLATGDRVLVKNQSSAADNGIYIVGTTPARAEDYATWTPHVAAIISVSEGTANVNTLWLCTSNAGGTLGSTSLSFSRVNNAAGIANTPAGGIAATTVQAAIDELDTEKAPKASPTFTGNATFGAWGGTSDGATIRFDASSTFSGMRSRGASAVTNRWHWILETASGDIGQLGTVNGDLLISVDEGNAVATSRAKIRVDGADAFTVAAGGDATAAGAVRGLGLGLGTSLSATIASGVATISRPGWIVVDTEASAATDDLDTITLAGVVAGDILVLSSTNNSRDPTAKDGTGNLRLAGDFVFTNTNDRLVVEWNGSVWNELSRADND